MELETKLREYRARKNREAKINKLKDKFKSFLKWNKSENDSQQQQLELLNSRSEDELDSSHHSNINLKEEDEEQVESNGDNQINRYKLGFYVTSTLAWILMYYIFIQLQFGIIYLITSALIGIYLNTRTGPKNPNEISAYSVFNKNCESIDGTLKAEQFEREIRYGAQSVH